MQVNEVARWLWAAGFIGHILLLTVLVVRRRARRFPAFTIFVLWNLSRTVLLFCIYRFGSKHTYYYAYWWFAVVDTLIQFGIIYEMYLKTFHGLGVWAQDVRKAFLVLIAVSLFVSIALMMTATPHTNLGIQSITMKGDFFSALWMGMLFIGMMVISVHSGVPWHAHVGRISQALGFYCLINALLIAMETYFGLGANTTPYLILQQIRQIIYLGCVLYWIVMLWKEAPEMRRMSEELRRQLVRLSTRVESDLRWVRTRKLS